MDGSVSRVLSSTRIRCNVTRTGNKKSLSVTNIGMNFKYRTGTVSVKYNKMPIFSEYGTGTVLKVKRLGDRSSQKKRVAPTPPHGIISTGSIPHLKWSSLVCSSTAFWVSPTLLTRSVVPTSSTSKHIHTGTPSVHSGRVQHC